VNLGGEKWWVRTSRRRGAIWNEEGRQGTSKLGAIFSAIRRWSRTEVELLGREAAGSTPQSFWELGEEGGEVSRVVVE
jgi:hypothetical protein